MDKQDIKNFTLSQLQEEMRKISEPAYRAQQIFLWLYHKGRHNFDEMRNLPKPLKEKLEGRYYIGSLEQAERLKSTDGTEKFLFKLPDENSVETVLIPSINRETICISTQVGCKHACRFCASGQGGFVRNLSASEITGQVLYIQECLKIKVTNFVFMGIGEPLDNYDNLSTAIMIMNDPAGMAIAARRMTISTCGIIPGIKRLKGLGLQVNLAVSLHAVNDTSRSELMPVNKVYPLEALIRSCEDYIEATDRRITLEYILIEGKNDLLRHADELAAVAKRLKAKVNLIPHSVVGHTDFRPPSPKRIDEFVQRLTENKVNVMLRRSKGADIRAACGQLAGRK